MAKLSDLTPDASNANKGTERGRYALETSLRKYGAGRSILIDKSGRIIAGNKTAETAADVGIDDVIIVKTDGRQLVAVQRTDLDLDSKEARELAYADNRAGELDLSFNADQVLADMQAGVDLSAFWFDNEIDAMLSANEQTALSDASDNTIEGFTQDKGKQIKPVLFAADLADFERAILATGVKVRGDALMKICRYYLGHSEEGQQYVGFESLLEA